jgi:hypothetical protein
MEDTTMKSTLFALLTLVLLASLGCGGSSADTAAPAEDTVQTASAAPADEAVVEARHDVIYTCNCGPSCDCNTVAVEPGTCTCGTELTGGHVLMVDGNVATVCTCGADCSCELDPDDPTKCGCGEDVKMVSLEGTGLYYCNCGGSCKCNYVSDEPGTCSCGMELVTS